MKQYKNGERKTNITKLSMEQDTQMQQDKPMKKEKQTK